MTQYPPMHPSAPSGPQVRDLSQLRAALDARYRQPIVSLRQAIESLGFIEHEALTQLDREEPDLLRSRSGELVERLLLTPDELHRALAAVAGLVEVDVQAFRLDERAFDDVTLRQARRLGVLPLGGSDEAFYVASWRPTDEALSRELRSLTGRSVVMVWASREAIEHSLAVQSRLALGHLAIETAQQRAADDPGRPAPAAEPLWTSADATLDQLMQQAVTEVGDHPDADASDSLSQSAGMVRLVHQLIADAMRLKASDIHIESNADHAPVTVRLRRDGDLETYLTAPASLRGPLVSRIKIMARLDIAERRRPQDGRIDFADFGGPALDLRVAVMPTHDGLEDVVLRLLQAEAPKKLAELGLQARDRATFAELSRRSFGMVLAVGPTGSGKTTTLHAMLAEMNRAERKIWTAEDPIEIVQPGLRQVQVNARIGMTFANAMRGFLRADPDIIMIGEIRDAETAGIAVEASLTGHLVLSTLHTNNASESVVRLLDLGMDPFNFADSLLAVVAQRLVRALCTRCRQPETLSVAQWSNLVHEYAEDTALREDVAAQRLLEAAGATHPQQVRIWRAVGCPHCSGKGYKGRLGVFELLQNDPSVRQLVQAKGRPRDIQAAAVADGMRTLRHDALEKVVQGLIDLDQARTAYR